MSFHNRYLVSTLESLHGSLVARHDVDGDTHILEITPISNTQDVDLIEDIITLVRCRAVESSRYRNTDGTRTLSITFGDYHKVPGASPLGPRPRGAGSSSSDGSNSS